MIKNKKSFLAMSTVAVIIITIIGGLAIITVMAYILGAFTDPNKIQDGIKCRLVIQASATFQEATQGLTPQKLIEACPTIEKTLPLKVNYPTLGGNIHRMNKDELSDVIKQDFAELINNAWWITAEGDRAAYLRKKFKEFFKSTNDCYVVYAIRIDTPKEFTPVTENALLKTLKHLTRAEIRQGLFKGDTRTIMQYITLDNKGAGVFFNASNSKIEYQEQGADPLYGIAVGFAKEAGIAELATKIIFGDNPRRIKDGQSFIYIAPYGKIGSMCRVL